MTDDQPGSAGDGTAGARPRALADELRWVHDMLRRDLHSVRDLARRVADGAPPSDIHSELHGLHSGGALFQLRVNCLSYCRSLGSHHRNEDDILFPAVRAAAPQLRATVDQLEADHRVVAALLDRIDDLAQHLARRRTRRALVDALDALASNLLRHLELEEAQLRPVLEAWEALPESTPSTIVVARAR